MLQGKKNDMRIDSVMSDYKQCFSHIIIFYYCNVFKPYIL